MNKGKIACLGGGLIGASWATSFAYFGYEVCIYDISKDVLSLSLERVRQNLALMKKYGAVDEASVERILAGVKTAEFMEEALKGAFFVQENGPENYEIKQKMVEEFEKYASSDCIFASSTSGLLISEIAKFAKRPERFIAAHPFNPPHLIPLVEITKSDKTAPDVLEKAKAVYLSCKKEPVVLNKESVGFIANRIQTAVWREMVDLVNKGVCSLEDADKAVTFGPGIRWGIMGPALVFHLGGGQEGIYGFWENQMAGTNAMLDTMAAWEKLPENTPEQSRAGVEEILKNRSAEIGNSIETLQVFRDKMVINMLKLHGKL